MKFISLLQRRTMLVVEKPVTWPLDPYRQRNTGSRYKDILIVASERPKSLIQCHKNNSLIPLLTRRFSTETALGGGDHFTPFACINN